MVKQTFTGTDWLRILDNIWDKDSDAMPVDVNIWLWDQYQIRIQHKTNSSFDADNWRIVLEFHDPQLATLFLLHYV